MFPGNRLLWLRERRGIYEEAVLRNGDYIDPEAKRLGLIPKADLLTYEDIEFCYRQLIKKYKDQNDNLTADDFYIGEKEARRLRRAPSSIIYFFYALLSSYGTSYWQAFFWLVMMVATFAALFLFTGFQIKTAGNASSPGRVIEYDLSANHARWAPVNQIAKDYWDALLFTVLILGKQSASYEALGPETSLLWWLALSLCGLQVLQIGQAVVRHFKH